MSYRIDPPLRYSHGVRNDRRVPMGGTLGGMGSEWGGARWIWDCDGPPMYPREQIRGVPKHFGPCRRRAVRVILLKAGSLLQRRSGIERERSSLAPASPQSQRRPDPRTCQCAFYNPSSGRFYQRNPGCKRAAASRAKAQKLSVPNTARTIVSSQELRSNPTTQTDSGTPHFQ